MIFKMFIVICQSVFSRIIIFFTLGQGLLGVWGWLRLVRLEHVFLYEARISAQNPGWLPIREPATQDEA